MKKRGVVVLQARTNSSRLPAKCLLPMGGMALAVLAARRAANNGRDVIVATSTSEDDDALIAELARHKLRSFRGSLDDVLQRFVDAIDGLDENDVVVRLTADNVFPDGRLIDEIESEFHQRGLEYLACGGEESGLPYGVSVEVTRAGHLRDALRSTSAGGDREHVTPWVIRRFGYASFSKYRGMGKSHYRCTVDSYDDYIVVQRLFARVRDPVSAPFASLIDALEEGRYQPVAASPAPLLVLGTAQLGMVYGIANTRGVPSAAESERIVKTAIGNGITWIDTARGYDRSEAVLGDILGRDWSGRVRIATKLSPLAGTKPDAPPESVQAQVDASVFESCMQLRTRRIEAVMLHRAAHFSAWGGAAWQRLLALRDHGVIGMLGVSVQTPKELELALATPDVSIVQMPFNIIDWRWDALVERIRACKETRALIIHVRSPLLQGLLTSREARSWKRAHVEDATPVWDWLATACERLACANVPELCIRYARSQDWIDGVVVGMESMDQLVANIGHFATPNFSDMQLRALEAGRPRLQERTLNPASWLPEDMQ